MRISVSWLACCLGVCWFVDVVQATPPDVPAKYVEAIEALVEKAERTIAEGPYQAKFDDLARVEPAPEWFRDAKFGIYFHWGVYSVPAYGNEWYPRHMYLPGRAENKHHQATYGDPAEYPYSKFVPRFTAEKFDADDWAELFKQSGARFAGPVAEHHDGFAMWASELTPWNAAERGPRRDLTAELAKAIRQRDMRFVATFHHARNSGHFSGVAKNYSALLADPLEAFLIGHMPRERFEQLWLAKLVEVIDRYEPDLIWFDSWLHEISEQRRAEFAAYYYNRAKQWNREVVITRKQNDLPLTFSLEDFEKGRASGLRPDWWLTDDTISTGSWCYTTTLGIKPVRRVLHDFIDIVSKRGCLLLNLSPLADGTIPDNQRQVLLDIGRWLKVNGEAIYDTRPWEVYGEGPTKMSKGGHFVKEVKYQPQDVRYTQSKDGQTLYATTLGWPEKALVLEQTRVDDQSQGQIALLGYDQAVEFTVNDQRQLVIQIPELTVNQRPCRHAYVWRLSGFQWSQPATVKQAAKTQ